MSQEGFASGPRYGKWWIVVLAFLLFAVAAGGGVLAWRHVGGSHPVEVTLTVGEASTAEVYVSGAVANEGIYTFTEDSSLGDIARAAGGLTEGADLSSVGAYFPAAGESLLAQPQKVNINTAEAWLLDALPGIGDVRAQAIVDYRTANGFFSNVDELIMVEGIGVATLEGIRDRITVV